MASASCNRDASSNTLDKRPGSWNGQFLSTMRTMAGDDDGTVDVDILIESSTERVGSARPGLPGRGSHSRL